MKETPDEATPEAAVHLLRQAHPAVEDCVRGLRRGHGLPPASALMATYAVTGTGIYRLEGVLSARWVVISQRTDLEHLALRVLWETGQQLDVAGDEAQTLWAGYLEAIALQQEVARRSSHFRP